MLMWRKTKLQNKISVRKDKSVSQEWELSTSRKYKIERTKTIVVEVTIMKMKPYKKFKAGLIVSNNFAGFHEVQISDNLWFNFTVHYDRREKFASRLEIMNCDGRRKFETDNKNLSANTSEFFEEDYASVRSIGTNYRRGFFSNFKKPDVRQASFRKRRA